MVFFSSSFKSTNQLSGIAKRCACCMWHQDLIDEDECYVVSWLHIETHCSVYPWFASKLWGTLPKVCQIGRLKKGLSSSRWHRPRSLKDRFVQTCQLRLLRLLSARLEVQSTQLMIQELLKRGQPQRQRHQHRYPKSSCIRPEILPVMKQPWLDSHDILSFLFHVLCIGRKCWCESYFQMLEKYSSSCKRMQKGDWRIGPPPKNVQTWCRWLNLQLLETMMRCKNIFRRYRHGLSGNCFLCWAWNAQGQVSGRFFVPTVWVLCNLPVQAGVNPNYFKGLESAFAYFLSDLM